VPKIAVDEDRNLLLQENYIGRPFQSLVVPLEMQADLPKLSLNHSL